jgi:hypothetical protein
MCLFLQKVLLPEAPYLHFVCAWLIESFENIPNIDLTCPQNSICLNSDNVTQSSTVHTTPIITLGTYAIAITAFRAFYPCNISNTLASLIKK